MSGNKFNVGDKVVFIGVTGDQDERRVIINEPEYSGAIVLKNITRNSYELEKEQNLELIK